VKIPRLGLRLNCEELREELIIQVWPSPYEQVGGDKQTRGYLATIIARATP
jgi:hypothetical protein